MSSFQVITDQNQEIQEFDLSDRQFSEIAKIAEQEFGLSLQPAKKALVKSRLVKRLRAVKAKDFDQYFTLLRADTSHKGEMTHLLSALTTNVTHFFRERHHFKLLEETILPPLIDRARKGGRVRIWSAACSSGQEAYCLAMTLLEKCPDAAALDIKILATDVDPMILQQATTGEYEADDVDSQDKNMVRKYFDDAGSGKIKAATAIKSIISFGRINLVSAWPVSGPFDAIMCRNVAIYFDKPTQAKLWKRYADVLAKDGYLMIGHSERINGEATSLLKTVGITAYQKQSVPSDSTSPLPTTSNTPIGDTA